MWITCELYKPFARIMEWRVHYVRHDSFIYVKWHVNYISHSRVYVWVMCDRIHMPHTSTWHDSMSATSSYMYICTYTAPSSPRTSRVQHLAPKAHRRTFGSDTAARRAPCHSLRCSVYINMRHFSSLHPHQIPDSRAPCHSLRCSVYAYIRHFSDVYPHQTADRRAPFRRLRCSVYI